MRILAISFGTEGDTRPIVALCRGLMAAGHQTRLLVESSGVELASTSGVPAVALAGDIRQALSGLLSEGMHARASGPAMTEALADIAKECTTAWMTTLLEEARQCDAIVFSGLTAYVALSISEYLRIPLIGAGLQPVSVTREFPSPFLPRAVPGWCNRWSHRLVMSMIWRSFRDSINDARAEVTHQAPRSGPWKDYPAIFGISPCLVPQPRDWPGCHQITGYWHGESDEWQPPQALAQFLGDGEPPIFVGFGSMVGFNHSRVIAKVVDALNGRRALLSSGWSGMNADGLPANVFPIGPAPHDRLFPRVSVVVHHGGAGTSHTAARAGVPSVVVPFAGDQFFWGTRLAAAGIAPDPIPYKSLEIGLLRDRIRCATSESMRQRAAGIGRAMQAESGVKVAVNAIETFVRKGIIPA